MPARWWWACSRWNNGKMLKGKLKTADTARAQYEDVVDRSAVRPPPPRDPVLLELVRQDNYDLSIFPATFGGTRKVRIHYLVPAFNTNGVVQCAYPHAFTPDPSVSIKKGPGVTSYTVVSDRSQNELTNSEPLILDTRMPLRPMAVATASVSALSFRWLTERRLRAR